MEVSENSRFQVCPETSKQAKVNKRNNQQKIIELPGHLYKSFLVHSKPANTKISSLGPWITCEEKHDSVLLNPCRTNRPYSNLNLLHAATMETLSNIDFSVDHITAKSSIFSGNNKKSKVKNAAINPKDVRSKMKVKNMSSAASGRDSGSNPSSPRSPRRNPPARTSSKLSPHFYHHGSKDITYKFATDVMDHTQHTDVYRNAYTYKVINQFHELRQSNQSFRTTFFDRDLFLAKCRNKRIQNSIEKKLQQDEKTTAHQQPKMQSILLSLNNRLMMLPQNKLTKKISSSNEYNNAKRCHSAKCVKCSIEGCKKEGLCKTAPPSPKVDEEIVPSSTKHPNIDGLFSEQILQKSRNGETAKGGGETPAKISCSTVCKYVLNKSSSSA